MYYFDLLLNNNQEDKNYFLSIIFSHIHSLQYENNLIISINFEKHFIRIFQYDKNVLENFKSSDFITKMKKYNYIITSKVLETKETEYYEVFIRDRLAEKLNKNKNNSKYFKDMLNTVKSRNYIHIYSESTNRNFNLYIKRDVFSSKEIENKNINKPTSYGLSQSNSLIYLPIFETTLDI